MTHFFIAMFPGGKKIARLFRAFVLSNSPFLTGQDDPAGRTHPLVVGVVRRQVLLQKEPTVEFLEADLALEQRVLGVLPGDVFPDGGPGKGLQAVRTFPLSAKEKEKKTRCKKSLTKNNKLQRFSFDIFLYFFLLDFSVKNSPI